jgi:hypothetical protein
VSQRLGPIKREEFIRRLRALGFAPLEHGTRHDYMTYAEYDLHIPSDNEYDMPMHQQMLKEVEMLIKRKITRKEWREL